MSETASTSTSLVPVNGGSLQSQRPGEIEQLDTITTDLKRSSAMASGIMESEAASAGQMKLLLDHAKKIVVQLRGMVDYDVDLRDDDGSLPPYDKLVGRLTHAFRHQAEINQMNAKLLSFSYVANLSNYAKNRQLQKAIARGRRQIMELQNTVTSLEGSVDTLTVEVDVQRKTAERLKVALDNTRGLLETTMVEYRQELSRQREVLRKQSTVMERLWQSKFNQDFVLDSILFIFSMWSVNTMLIDYPVRTALGVTMSPSRRRTWARQMAKLFAFFVILRKMREGAAEYGIHNRVGATYPYIASVFSMAYAGLVRRVTGSPAPSSDEQALESA